jgi:hypothetical protein
VFRDGADRMWAQLPAVAGDGMIVLDIDASLVQVHSEKKRRNIREL